MKNKYVPILKQLNKYLFNVNLLPIQFNKIQQLQKKIHKTLFFFVTFAEFNVTFILLVSVFDFDEVLIFR